MTLSPILGITQVAPAQSNKEVTINNAFAVFEAASNANMTVDFTSGDVTLTAGQLTQHFVFVATNNTVVRNLIIPLLAPDGTSATQRTFVVRNPGSADITVKGATGATATALAGTITMFYCDGTNVYFFASSGAGSSTVTFSNLPTEVQNLPIGFPFQGTTTASVKLCLAIAQNTTIPANLVGTTIKALTAPAADTTFTLKYWRTGTETSIGNIVIHSDESVTLPTSSSVSLVPGDLLVLHFPTSPDTNLADGCVTVMANKV